MKYSSWSIVIAQSEINTNTSFLGGLSLHLNHIQSRMEIS